MRKTLLRLCLIILAISIGFVLPGQTDQSTELIIYELPSIKIILVGDTMLDRGVEYMVDKYGQGDFRFPFLKIADYLKTADIVLANLEGPISDQGTKVGSIYSFRMDPRVIGGLTFANINMVSLANNHAFDYGRLALEDTVLRLKTAGIDCVGNGSAVIKNILDTKIAFLAYTAFGINGISEDDFDAIKAEIKTTKQNADILIVSLHAGEEYQKTPTILQVDFAKMARDAGADVFVGHHPHIIQPDFYSLGNFIFDQGFSEETMRGEIVEIQIQNKKITGISAKEIIINSFFQPEIKN